MPTIKLTSSEIWLKGTGNASQVWSPTVSGLPAGAIINSVTLTFSSGNTYASPGRTEIFWGSEAVAANRVWYVSQSSGSGGTIDLTGRVKGNGSFSLLFRKTANSAGSQSNVYFSGITITIDYTNPISTISLDKTTLDAGSTMGVTINRVDSSYTHKVTFAFGSRSYTATGVGTSVSYTIPVAWLDQIPNSVSGTGTVTVETISGSGASMGSVSASFTMTAGAGVVPTVGTITAELLDGLDGLYIQGHSRCKVAVSGHSAGTGATVASVLITGNGDSAWADNLTSGLLRTAGTVTFTVTVKDSRGREASGSISITVEAYTDIAITGRTALRCTSDGTVSRTKGKSAKLGCSYAMTAVGSNAATVRVYWRVYGTEAWTEITGWDSASGYTAVALVDAVALDERYEFRFAVADKVSVAEQTAVIAPGSVFMVWSKIRNAFGFGAYPTEEKQVAIAEDWRLMLGSTDVGNAIRQRDRVRNLLDNSDFRNPVNQRGASSYSGNFVRSIDRWLAAEGPSGSVSVKIEDGGITFTTSGGGIVYLIQRFEKGYLDLSKQHTIVAYMADGTVSFSGYIDTSEETMDGVNVTFPSGSKIKCVALYEGVYTADTLPPYVPKGYAAELAECQRYYQKYNTVGLTCRNNGYATAILPVVMRVTPTISVGTRLLFTSSYTDVAADYPSVNLQADPNLIYFTNNFYTGFATLTCSNVQLSADL